MSLSRRAEPEPTEETSVGHRILESIAEREDTSPLELDPVLGEVVDPDALEDLFREGVTGRVTFTYLGYRVRVGSDGRVTVSEVSE